jgi:hypothetical protein
MLNLYSIVYAVEFPATDEWRISPTAHDNPLLRNQVETIINKAIIKAENFKQARAIAFDVADDNQYTKARAGTLIVYIRQLQEPAKGKPGYVYPTTINKTYKKRIRS